VKYYNYYLSASFNFGNPSSCRDVAWNLDGAGINPHSGQKKSPTVLKVEPGVFPEIIAINVFAKLFPTSSGAPDYSGKFQTPTKFKSRSDIHFICFGQMKAVIARRGLLRQFAADHNNYDFASWKISHPVIPHLNIDRAEFPAHSIKREHLSKNPPHEKSRRQSRQ
jgi:hypothetical protein